MQTKFQLIVSRTGNQLTVRPAEDETDAIIKFMVVNPDQDIKEHFALVNGGTVYNLDKFDCDSISIYCPSTDEVFEAEVAMIAKFKDGKKVYLKLA
jgi:hypothetical protein